MSKRARLDRLAPSVPYPPDPRSDDEVRREVLAWLDGDRPPTLPPPRQYDRAREAAEHDAARRAVLDLLAGGHDEQV